MIGLFEPKLAPNFACFLGGKVEMRVRELKQKDS